MERLSASEYLLLPRRLFRLPIADATREWLPISVAVLGVLFFRLEKPIHQMVSCQNGVHATVPVPVPVPVPPAPVPVPVPVPTFPFVTVPESLPLPVSVPFPMPFAVQLPGDAVEIDDTILPQGRPHWVQPVIGADTSVEAAVARLGYA